MAVAEGASLVVVRLPAAGAREPRTVGAKAANLARAAAAGLPVLPGFVLVPSAAPAPAPDEAVRRAWEELSDGGTRPLVVRSSSAQEDAADSSMAGWYESVLDVRGWPAFTEAVRTVLASARRVLLPPPAAARRRAAWEEGGAEPGCGMAVLVQPMVHAEVGGVLFGVDPVAGRDDRILVSAVRGGPDRLVDGSTQGTRYQLTRRARLVAAEPAEPRRARLLGTRRRARLTALARRTERVFGGPQDIEFGFDGDGRLWLFQARPITATAARPPRGARLLGPGPVAETFPRVLQPLEEDLWIAPMSHGLTVAVDTAGAAPRRRLRTLPAVTTVDGHAAADLRLLGAVPPAHRWLQYLNPLPGARRAGAAWRMGRLRAALPLLAVDLTADVDRQLAEFPAPDGMLSGRLLDAVAWGRTVLSALHAQESLAGSLLGAGSGATAAGEALAVLAETRRGPDDAALIAAHPVLLALLPPTLGERPPLPPRSRFEGVPRGVGRLPVREALRLRIRWVQEMQARMGRELARRLVAAGRLDDPGRLALLRWHELKAAADGKGLPADLPERLPRPEGAALPAAFRLAGSQGTTVVAARGASAGGAQGASAGYGAGIAWDGAGPRPARAVLVVRTLDPALAPVLPGLAGLVAETGSVLSHLAVLAREYGIPAAVGVPAALDRFPPGTAMSVDGGSGAVERTVRGTGASEGPGSEGGTGREGAAA